MNAHDDAGAPKRFGERRLLYHTRKAGRRRRSRKSLGRLGSVARGSG